METVFKGHIVMQPTVEYVNRLLALPKPDIKASLMYNWINKSMENKKAEVKEGYIKIFI